MSHLHEKYVLNIFIYPCKSEFNPSRFTASLAHKTVLSESALCVQHKKKASNFPFPFFWCKKNHWKEIFVPHYIFFCHYAWGDFVCRWYWTGKRFPNKLNLQFHFLEKKALEFLIRESQGTNIKFYYEASKKI